MGGQCVCIIFFFSFFFLFFGVLWCFWCLGWHSEGGRFLMSYVRVMNVFVFMTFTEGWQTFFEELGCVHGSEEIEAM